MLSKITVKPDTRAANIFFFNEIDFTKMPDKRIIPLFGPNGVGKSTLIKIIRTYTNTDTPQVVMEGDGKPSMIFSYVNGEDNFKFRKARSFTEEYDPAFFNARYDAHRVSEGQSVIFSLFDLLDALKPGENAFQYPDKDTVILLDEVDSGLSLDNIDIIMQKLKYAMRKRDDLQIIMSFNSPRVLKHFPHVLSMYDGNVLEMHTDEDMLAEIKNHEKMFNKRRKTARGRPRVFD